MCLKLICQKEKEVEGAHKKVGMDGWMDGRTPAVDEQQWTNYD